jgi:hypothetical protein
VVSGNDIPQLNSATVSFPTAPYDETQAPSRGKTSTSQLPLSLLPFLFHSSFLDPKSSIDQFNSHPQPSIQNGDP